MIGAVDKNDPHGEINTAPHSPTSATAPDTEYKTYVR